MGSVFDWKRFRIGCFWLPPVRGFSVVCAARAGPLRFWLTPRMNISLIVFEMVFGRLLPIPNEARIQIRHDGRALGSAPASAALSHQ